MAPRGSVKLALESARYFCLVQSILLLESDLLHTSSDNSTNLSTGNKPCPMNPNKTHQGPLLTEVDGFQVIDCECCGFKHVWPYPDYDDLADLYQDSYYEDVYPFPVDMSPGEIDSARSTFGKRLIQLEENLSSERRRLLDVGAGNCEFLYAARERGWDVIGIDPSRQGAERARALDIPFIKGFFKHEAMCEVSPFDAIHLNCVLEHMLEPVEMLHRCYDCLKPGGLVYISVPNDFNPLQKALTKTTDCPPWWVVPMQHINYFDPQSLYRLFESIGFEPQLADSSFPIELFLLFGENYVGNPQLGAVCFQKIQAFEKAMKEGGQLTTLEKLYQILFELGIGRRIQLMAKKPEPSDDR